MKVAQAAEENAIEEGGKEKASDGSIWYEKERVTTTQDKT